jgi:signal transduction histidine kinase/response regulator RpfG family c-di-GMP phosphodiesterase
MVDPKHLPHNFFVLIKNVSILFLIFFLILGIYQFNFNVLIKKNETEIEIHEYINSKKRSLHSSITNEKWTQLQKIVNSIQAKGPFKQVIITINKNKIIKSPIKVIDNNPFLFIPSSFKKFVTLKKDQKVLGHFTFHIDSSLILELIRPQVLWNMWSIFFKIFFLFFILMLSIHKLLISPINRLKENLDRIDWVNLFKIRDILPLKNEISILNDSFNQLIDSLKKYQTKLNEQNFKLEEISQQKTHFFQDISHEIRTPLTLILTPLENLSIRYHEEKDFTVAFNNSKKLYRLVNNFLEFQKLISRKKINTMIPVNICEFIDNYFNMFTDNYYLKGIDFRILVPHDLKQADIFIQVEIDSLEKIIFNFLSNSLKFSPKGSRISFGIERSDGIIKIFVKDNGVGIPDNKQKEIFNPYNNEQNNSSFGLSLAKKLAENMGGQIGFQSKSGQGSSFWVKFKEVTNIKETIDLLIVEDEEDCVEALEILIEKLSHCKSYKIASSVKEAREILNKYNLKCILTDSNLPDEEGTSFLSHAFQIQPKASRLLVTGMADEFIIQKATNEAKVDFIIFKPWDEEDLLKILNNALKRPFEQVKFIFDDWQLADVVNANEEPNKNYEKTLDEFMFYNSKTLLFIDDQSEMRELINVKLKSVGYNTICRANGKLGLAAVYKHKPDIIITNWLMPEMSGPELIIKLKEDENLKHIPIILLTAKTSDECRDIGLDLGADAFIGKPFDFRELKSITKNLLKLKSTEKNLFFTHNELKEKQNSIKTLMDNLEEGLFVFDDKGIIQPGFSKSTINIFGIDPTFKSFEEVLCLESAQKYQFRKWCQQIWGGKYDFYDLVNLAPKIFSRGKKIIELDFKPIYKFLNNKKIVGNIICIASDKTKEINLEKKSQKEKMKAKMLIHIIRDPQGIRKITKSALKLIHIFFNELKLEFSKMDLEKLEKIIYYLQVKFASHSIHHIYEITHQLDKSFFYLKYKDSSEKTIQNICSHLKNLQENVEIFIEEQNNLYLVDDIHKKNVRQIDISKIQSVAENIVSELGKDHIIFKEFKNRFFFEQISKSFKKYKEKIEELASKKEIDLEFKVVPSPIKINLERFSPLINSFIHIFRNTIDHGIEPSHERKTKGKSRTSKITLSFFQENIQDLSFLKIISMDDGRGINPSLIRKKASEREILPPKEINQLSDDEVIQLIFLPHFSTQSYVTETSGRGIGMDEVKNQVTILGGKIHVDSKIDKGTTITIHVPLNEPV